MSKLNYDASYTFYLKKGLSGNLGNKPELFKTKEGNPYAKVTMYCNFSENKNVILPKDEPRSISFIVTFFGYIAEKVCDELNIGDFIAVYPSSIRITKAVDEETGALSYLFLASVASEDNVNLLSRPGNDKSNQPFSKEGKTRPSVNRQRSTADRKTG
jgi:single-stranded DNA-binding protein